MLHLAIPLYPQKESVHNQVLTLFQNEGGTGNWWGEGGTGGARTGGGAGGDGATDSTSINCRIKSSGTHKVDADCIT